MPPPDTADHLRELRERLQATQDAAERLAGEAAGAARARAERRVPAAGWAAERAPAGVRDELEEIAALLRALRELVPPELQAQVAEVLRQVLLLLRALLDWWVERLEDAGPGARPGAAPPASAAQDIPVS
jgi:hypothetical protein